jgi:hypothetical protein
MTLTFRRRRPAPNAFEREYALEVLRSGLLRVRLLIAVVSSALIFVLTMSFIFPSQFLTAFRGNWNGFTAMALAIAGANLAFLIFEHVLLTRLIRKQQPIAPALNYVSAVIETSIPTAGMYVGSLFLGPTYTLFTPTLLCNSRRYELVPSAWRRV